MKTPKLFRMTMTLAALLAAAPLAHATLFSESWTVNGTTGVAIPDGNLVGLADSHVDTTIPAMINGDSATIQDITVNLNITGGYNGDLYGYLVLQPAGGGAVTEVLLNRVGQDGTHPFGDGGSGFNVTLSDAGTSSIHGATGSPVSGVFTPDSPSTLDGTFGGAVASGGTWTLFLADLASGDTSTLVSWGVNVSVVPEPITWALIGFAVAAGLVRFRAWRKPAARQA
jgi:hypothetical protein